MGRKRHELVLHPPFLRGGVPIRLSSLLLFLPFCSKLLFDRSRFDKLSNQVGLQAQEATYVDLGNLTHGQSITTLTPSHTCQFDQ